MAEQFKDCSIYVDHEGLLVGLSQRHYWNIHDVIVGLSERAGSRFRIKQVRIFGNWPGLAPRLALENQGFICESSVNHGDDPLREIQHSIANDLSSDRTGDVCLIIGSNYDYSPILKQINQGKSESLLWTIARPTADEIALCSSWEIIDLPPGSRGSVWPRQVMLNAIVLTAEHLSSPDDSLFLTNHLIRNLQALPPFQYTAETWVNVALRERIILLQQTTSSLEPRYSRLNRQNPFVLKAFQVRDRILSVLNAMIAGRDWVAFGALDKALRTAKPLAGNKKYRQAWLEMLIAENVLVAEKIRRNGTDFPTTTLRPNKQHPSVKSSLYNQKLKLTHLIVAADNYMKNRGAARIPISKLLQLLTSTTTRIEARSALDDAKVMGLVQLRSAPSRRNEKYLTTTVELDEEHTLVKESLEKRSYVIRLADYILGNRDFLSENLGISRSLFTDELVASREIEEADASFWIDLLINENILCQATLITNHSDIIRLLRLQTDNSVISYALRQSSEVAREVPK